MGLGPLGWALGCGSSAPPSGGSDGGLDAGAEAGIAAPAPQVELSEGTAIGIRGSGFQEFLGIPYAAAPIGPLRWRPPASPGAFEAPLVADSPPARCPQDLLGPSGTEDCLYLNVHSPDPRPAGAPVIVWIHGGGFVFGEGLQVDEGTRGDRIAADHGLVVVSLNYRLGALGFLSHPALSAESADGVSGNYGLLDQIAALRWVQQNIASFGGDPANVTLAGESAGAISVCSLLAMPEAAGLFHRAIAQSGPCGAPTRTLAASEDQGVILAASLGCEGSADPAACLRAIAPEALVAASDTGFSGIASGQGLPFGPVVDGHWLPEAPYDRFVRGDFHRVPLLYGWNRDEGTLFVNLAQTEPLLPEAYPAALLDLARGSVPLRDQILAAYPLDAYPDATYALSAVVGDVAITCPARRALLALSAHTPSYAYYFTYPDAVFQLVAQFDLGAFHSAEIQYVFGHRAGFGSRPFFGDDLALSEAMMGYWSRFAIGADPNDATATPWPAFDATEETHLELERTIQPILAPSSAACEFWESLGVF